MTNLGNSRSLSASRFWLACVAWAFLKDKTAHRKARQKITGNKSHTYCMQTFFEWVTNFDILARLRLIETYYSFDPAQYNRLFDDELAKLSVSSPEHREALERMRGFNWVGYIVKSLRNVGYRDQREVQERTHDIVAKLLTGTLFKNFDEKMHGPLDLRFKRSVANAIRNLVERERNRRRFIPTVPIGQEFQPGGVRADDLPDRSAGYQDDERLIDDFRQLVRSRLGELGIAVLNARLSGQETKSLVGRPDLGNPGRFQVKAVVRRIKVLCHDFGKQRGNSAFLREIERAIEREEETVQKRIRSTAARQSQVAG